MSSEQKQSQDDDDNRAYLRGFEQIFAQVIDKGSVHLVTKGQRLLIWNWQNGRVEVETDECAIDIRLKVFEWRVDANN